MRASSLAQRVDLAGCECQRHRSRTSGRGPLLIEDQGDGTAGSNRSTILQCRQSSLLAAQPAAPGPRRASSMGRADAIRFGSSVSYTCLIP